MAFVAPYIKRFLARQERALAARRPFERFLHLGHWDDPSTAGDDVGAAQQRLDEVLLELAELRDELRILDVGCGIGGTLAHVAERLPGAELVGLNIDPEQIDLARRLAQAPARGSLRFDVGDAGALPYELGSFDRILAIECAFHFPSRARFVAEAARVLVPGGLLVLSDILPTSKLLSNKSDPSWHRLRADIEAGLGPWPDFLGEEPELEALLARNGLALEVLRDATSSTLPSYAPFTEAPDAEAASLDDAEAARIDRAVGLLGRLQRDGWLRVIYAAARRTV